VYKYNCEATCMLSIFGNLPSKPPPKKKDVISWQVSFQCYTSVSCYYAYILLNILRNVATYNAGRWGTKINIFNWSKSYIEPFKCIWKFTHAIYILKIHISYVYLRFQMLVKLYTLIYNGKVTQIKQALAHHNTTVKQVLIKVNFQSQIAILPTREA